MRLLSASLITVCLVGLLHAQDEPAAESDASGPVALDAGTAALDPTNTSIQFIGTHAGDEPNPRVGVFEAFQGTATVQAGTLESVSVEIETSSLKTPIPDLTNHLKSPDFFDAREHPTAKFESTSISAGEGSSYTITGNLTILGNSQEVSFPVDVEVTDAGLTLKGTTELDRTSFGMDKFTERVNKDVELSVTVGKAAGDTAENARGRQGRRGPGGPFDPEAFFKRLDTDGDGQIAGDEIPERMAERIDRIDTDGDGAVSLEELQARMQRRRERGGPGGEGRGDRPQRPQRPDAN